MISRLRFYMTFDEEWTQHIKHPQDILQDALDAGFESYDEGYISFDYDEGVAILFMMSGRDSFMVRDIIVETFLENVLDLSESNFDIEIDLDAKVDDYNDF